MDRLVDIEEEAGDEVVTRSSPNFSARDVEPARSRNITINCSRTGR
jgi:hypothetical protein